MIRGTRRLMVVCTQKLIFYSAFIWQSSDQQQIIYAVTFLIMYSLQMLDDRLPITVYYSIDNYNYTPEKQ